MTAGITLRVDGRLYHSGPSFHLLRPLRNQGDSKLQKDDSHTKSLVPEAPRVAAHKENGFVGLSRGCGDERVFFREEREGLSSHVWTANGNEFWWHWLPSEEGKRTGSVPHGSRCSSWGRVFRQLRTVTCGPAPRAFNVKASLCLRHRPPWEASQRLPIDPCF